MGATVRAPSPYRPYLHQPVQIVAAVRASVWPAGVKRPQHPLLLTSMRSHRCRPPYLLLELGTRAGVPTGPPERGDCWPSWPTCASPIHRGVTANSTSSTEGQDAEPAVTTSPCLLSGPLVVLDLRPKTL